MQELENTTEKGVFEEELKSWISSVLTAPEGAESWTLIQSSKTVGGADEYAADFQGRKLLIKTYRNRPWIIRNTIGRFCIRNEYDAILAARKRGIQNVPQVYGMPDALTVVMEFITNRGHLNNPKHHADALQPEDFYRKTVSMIMDMHSRGICHGDVRRANILVGADNQPWLVDFAAAVVTDGKSSLLRRLLFRMLVNADCFALAKIVDSCYPEMLEGELSFLRRKVPWYLKLGRFYRQRVYRKIGRFFRNRRT